MTTRERWVRILVLVKNLRRSCHSEPSRSGRSQSYGPRTSEDEPHRCQTLATPVPSPSATTTTQAQTAVNAVATARHLHGSVVPLDALLLFDSISQLTVAAAVPVAATPTHSSAHATKPPSTVISSHAIEPPASLSPSRYTMHVIQTHRFWSACA